MTDVDTLLGNHETRYFGEGHKRTDYNVKEEGEQFYGEIKHRGMWSNKSERNIQPHLSTLDGVILSSILAEKVLENGGVVVSDLFLSKFEIKSGMKPIEDLNRIPIKIKESEFIEGKAIFHILVLDMKIKIEFQEIKSSNNHRKLESDSKAYLSEHLKYIHHNIYDISFLETLDTSDKCSIFCKANRTLDENNVYRGISSNVYPMYSLLELLIIFSQMAEMLAYHADSISRECSETLWMKNVEAEIINPIPNGEIELIGKIRKNKLLDMKGKNWKIFEMSGIDVKNRVHISSKIAHQLPDLEVLENA